MQQSQIGVRHCPDCGRPENAIGRFCAGCFHFKMAGPNVKAATFMRRFAATLLDIVLVPLTLVIGYLVWLLIVLANGQTPGKQLLGIRAMKVSGEPTGWCLAFIREILIKGILIDIVSWVTFGIFWLANYLFPLFDPDRQAIHDKIAGTVVVKNA